MEDKLFVTSEIRKEMLKLIGWPLVNEALPSTLFDHFI